MNVSQETPEQFTAPTQLEVTFVLVIFLALVVLAVTDRFEPATYRTAGSDCACACIKTGPK